ncbi:MAG: NAD(P)/FAD-dependent oxidoreductase [Streptococcaceae bacterium]|jgi:predicted Rossmann fold flavoprotein|nr:NAD(P)/FAD-dependent oxidoreductase [Streptococcaceae bacterium]
MKNYDVIVVGAGPSGMMAAISAAESRKKVLLLDKNEQLGRKLLLTGGGRCNVTNSGSVEEILANVPGNGRFLFSAFAQFDNRDIMAFFEKYGVALKEEDHGRIFPVSNKSRTIVEALVARLTALDVKFSPKQTVSRLRIENKQILGLETNSGSFSASKVILATGGKAYPATGSAGEGYELARAAGHSITQLYATESALISSESFICNKTLQGISLANVNLSVMNAKNKAIVTHRHDLIFTHFGLSGPAALRCSSFVNKELLKGAEFVNVQLDAFPDCSQAELCQKIGRLTKGSDKNLANALSSLTQERFLLFLIDQADLTRDLPAKQITAKQIECLAKLMKSLTIRIDKTFPIEKSFVTGGGVNLKEINPKTMESKLTQGLYLTGELLDINGYTGGYNVTCAFVTGWVAGHHAALEC